MVETGFLMDSSELREPVTASHVGQLKQAVVSGATYLLQRLETLWQGKVNDQGELSATISLAHSYRDGRRELK